MTKDSIRQIGVICATVIMIVINTLGDLIPYNGITSREVGDQLEVYFAPSNYTYSIWALIIAGLIAYSIFQALSSNKEDPFLRKIGWLYVASCLVNSGWMVFWHYKNFFLTMVVILVLMVMLIMIYKKLNIGKEKVKPGMRIFVHLPFSIYLGWITLTLLGNITYFLHAFGWDGFGLDQRIWAVVLIVLSVVTAELIAFNRQDLAFLAVFVWTLAGIAQAQYGVSPVFEAACAAIIFIVIIAIVTLIVRPRLRKSPS